MFWVFSFLIINSRETYIIHCGLKLVCELTTKMLVSFLKPKMQPPSHQESRRAAWSKGYLWGRGASVCLPTMQCG